jgi:hypothetical protein
MRIASPRLKNCCAAGARYQRQDAKPEKKPMLLTQRVSPTAKPVLLEPAKPPEPPPPEPPVPVAPSAFHHTRYSKYPVERYLKLVVILGIY